MFEDRCELSKQLSVVLDCLGYGSPQREFRKAAYKTLGELSSDEDFDCIIVGSKGEGITNVYENDKDILNVEKTSVCSECYKYRDPNKRNVFVMEQNNSPPGHTLLAPGLQQDTIGMLPGESKVDLDIGTVLSSSVFRYAVENFVWNSYADTDGAFFKPMYGPAIRVMESDLYCDQVFAIECHCPCLKAAWASLPRKYDWPPPAVIQKVCESQAFVVATGCNGSMFQKHEWRICFNIGEQLLVESLTDVQIKVYVLFKMVLKDIIKPEENELSSFMIKNIVFWMAELNPPLLFTEESLVQWLFYGLRMLVKCLKINTLPYYMIPSRNLFTGKFSEKRRLENLKSVRRIRKIGPRILFEIERLEKSLACLILAPDILLSSGDKRNEVEMLLLQANFLSFRSSVPIRSNVAYDYESEDVCDEEMMWNKIRDYVYPSWRRDVNTGKYDQEKFDEDLKRLLC